MTSAQFTERVMGFIRELTAGVDDRTYEGLMEDLVLEISDHLARMVGEALEDEDFY